MKNLLNQNSFLGLLSAPRSSHSVEDMAAIQKMLEDRNKCLQDFGKC